MKEKEESEQWLNTDAIKKAQIVCSECLQPTTEEELNMFGGLCEDCSFIDED